MDRFVNEYKYSKNDTKIALKAFNSFWKRKIISKYGSLVLAAFGLYLYASTGLVRFLVLGIILLLLFFLPDGQNALAAKYDAARIAEETGIPDPVFRYELDNEIRIFRAGILHITIPCAEIVGAKSVKGALAIFTKGNLTVLFKDDCYLEGGPTALRAYLREHKVNVK